jgi:hypothetical protein
VLDLGLPKGQTGNPQDTSLNDLTDVDTTRDATGMVITRQADGTYKGQHVRVGLNQLTDVTVLPNTPPNSLLGTVGEGTTPGQAEWEPLHLDYIQSTVLGPLPSTVADLGQRVTELEHTGEIVPPDYALTVDLYGGSFTRIIGCDAVTATPKRITVSLAVSPGPGGAVFASLADISGTGAVWADFAGTIGKVVDSSGTGINGASLKEAIRRGQIVTVHRGTDGTHPTLVVEKVEDPADAGSSLTLDALKNVAAPASTPAGMFLGTTGVGAWGPVANPLVGHLAAADPHAQYALRGLVGNLLTANQASGTDALGTTEGFAPSAIYSSVAVASGGVSGNCLQLNTVASNNGGGVSLNAKPDATGVAGSIPVVAGTTYTAMMMSKSSATSVLRIRIFWLNSSGQVVSSLDSADAPSDGTWRVSSVTGVAPAGAAYASVFIRRSMSTVGDTHLVDSLSFHVGAGGDWAMPGTPILNQGRRVSRPNGTDRLVEVWDGAAWVPVHYDSGERQIGGLMVNGWTGLLGLRRVGGFCRLKVQGIADGTAGQYLDPSTLPAGLGAGLFAIMTYRNGTTGAITTGRAGRVESAMPAAGQNLSSELVYIPDSLAVPTSLPGTLISTAP